MINSNPKTNPKKRMIIILMVFLMFLLIATVVVYSYYRKNSKQEAMKDEFFHQIINHDISFFLDRGIYGTIANKLQTQNFQSDATLKLGATMQNNMFSKLDLSKFEIQYHKRKNNNENKGYSKLDANYSGNHFLTLDFLWNAEQFAMKSDEIVNKYVGISKKNMQNLVNQLGQTEIDLSTEKKLKNFIFDREPIELENFEKMQSLMNYLNIVKKNTTAQNFSKKENVIVTLDAEQVSTTEYTMELDYTQTSQMLTQVKEELIKDDALLSELVVANVQNFEEDESEILEYTDNDNVSQVQGQENNYNTSINIWGENTTAQNTVTNETPTPSNSTENDNSVTNHTIDANTTQNTTTQQNTTQENTITENTINQDTNTTLESEIHQQTNPEPPSEPATTQTEPTQTTTEPIANQTTTQNVIEEEDNFRTQGFIAVKEPSEEESEEETFIVGENYEETMKNIEKLSQKIDWFSYLLSGAKANCPKEELAQNLESILDEKIKENNRLIVKMYVSDGKVIKLNLELSETPESLDFEMISKAENEKYLQVTVLKGKDDAASGYMANFYHKKDDAVTKSKISLHKIHKNKINQKTNIALETRGTPNSKKYSTSIDVMYSNNDGEFKLEWNDSLDFEASPEIDDLNNDNCLFLDSLPNEELLLTRDAIKEKTREVLREKNRNLNIIETTHSDSIVQQTEGQQPAQEDKNAKEEAKQILIQTISNKMREYLNAGNNLKIEDLEGLEIPNYEVEISFSSNLAIITVNGYKFKLDSDFNLSDS